MQDAALLDAIVLVEQGRGHRFEQRLDAQVISPDTHGSSPGSLPDATFASRSR